MEEKKLKEVEIPEISTSAENLLTIVAGFILFVGIIATLILAFVSIIKASFAYFGVALCTFFSIFATWAFLRVVANISLRLKAIQETMPRRLMTEKEVQQTEIF